MNKWTSGFSFLSVLRGYGPRYKAAMVPTTNGPSLKETRRVIGHRARSYPSLLVDVSPQIQGAQMGHVCEKNQDSLQGMTTGIGRHDTGRPLHGP